MCYPIIYTDNDFCVNYDLTVNQTVASGLVSYIAYAEF